MRQGLLSKYLIDATDIEDPEMREISEEPSYGVHHGEPRSDQNRYYLEFVKQSDSRAAAFFLFERGVGTRQDERLAWDERVVMMGEHLVPPGLESVTEQTREMFANALDVVRADGPKPPTGKEGTRDWLMSFQCERLEAVKGWAKRYVPSDEVCPIRLGWDSASCPKIEFLYHYERSNRRYRFPRHLSQEMLFLGGVKRWDEFPWQSKGRDLTNRPRLEVVAATAVLWSGFNMLPSKNGKIRGGMFPRFFAAIRRRLATQGSWLENTRDSSERTARSIYLRNLALLIGARWSHQFRARYCIFCGEGAVQ